MSTFGWGMRGCWQPCFKEEDFLFCWGDDEVWLLPQSSESRGGGGGRRFSRRSSCLCWYGVNGAHSGLSRCSVYCQILICVMTLVKILSWFSSTQLILTLCCCKRLNMFVRSSFFFRSSKDAWECWKNWEVTFGCTDGGGTIIEQMINEIWGIIDRTRRGQFKLCCIRTSGSENLSKLSWRFWSMERSVIEVLKVLVLIFLAWIGQEPTIETSNLKHLTW